MFSVSIIILSLISAIAFAEDGSSREERIETNYRLDDRSIFLVVNNKTSMPMTVFRPLLEKNITEEHVKSQSIVGEVMPNGQGTFLVGSLDDLIKKIGRQGKNNTLIKVAGENESVCGGRAPEGYGLARTCKELHAAAYLKFSFPDGMSYSGTDIFKIGIIKEQIFKIQPNDADNK